MAKEVAVGLTPHALDTFAPQAEGLAALTLGGHTNMGRSIERRDLDLAAERSGCEADRHLAVQIVVVTLENRVRLEMQLHIEIAGRTTVRSGLALARQTDAVALVDAGGDLHRKGLVRLDAARTAASSARLGDDLAYAVATRAGLLDGEETLLHPNLPLSAASRASLRFGTRLRTGALAFRAVLLSRNADLGFGAVRGVLERDLQVVPEVGPAVHTRSRPA